MLSEQISNTVSNIEQNSMKHDRNALIGYLNINLQKIQKCCEIRAKVMFVIWNSKTNQYSNLQKCFNLCKTQIEIVLCICNIRGKASAIPKMVFDEIKNIHCKQNFKENEEIFLFFWRKCLFKIRRELTPKNYIF